MIRAAQLYLTQKNFLFLGVSYLVKKSKGARTGFAQNSPLFNYNIPPSVDIMTGTREFIHTSASLKASGYL